MASFLQVTTTTGDRGTAERVATELVDRRLAGCVQISGPVTSTYHWKGEIEITEEWICTAKTREDKFAEIEKVLAEIHPYDVPELLATPIVAGGQSYLDWLAAELDR